MPTIRNARGSDMFIVNPDETLTLGIQSKALSKRSAIPLGTNVDKLQSDWWILTIHANSENPVCYILSLDEVRRLASQDKNGGAFWLEARHYDRDEFREAWHRLDDKIIISGSENIVTVPKSLSLENGGSIQFRNGVRRPGSRSVKCAAVWEYLDANPKLTIAEICEVGKARGWNDGNTKIEYYQWRKFHGLMKS